MFRPIAVACLLLSGTLAGQERPASGEPSPTPDALVERFLARTDPPPVSYRALRRLEARNERFNAEGWMEVATELTADKGFQWTLVSEGGSGYIRNKVLRRALETERDAAAKQNGASSALSRENYVFDERLDAALAGVPDGMARVGITPKRKDTLLVDGHVWLSATDADLLQVDGRLAKSPSFWTRTVDVMRRYARIGGVRVPVEMTSTAELRVAGVSTFRMTYRYEAINGAPVAATAGETQRP